MKKLTKFISLALGALMMLGAGVGIKTTMKEGNAGVNPETGEGTYSFITSATNKPVSSGSITNDTVTWDCSCTGECGLSYQTSYAGVQIGTGKKDGSLTISTNKAWGSQTGSTYFDYSIISKVTVYLNCGDNNGTYSLSIGGTIVASGKITKSANISSDYTKAYKVEYNNTTAKKAGVISLTVARVSAASYFCGIVIDCSTNGDSKTPLVKPSGVSISNGVISFTNNDSNASTFSALIKDSSDNTAFSGTVVSGSTVLPINKSGTYTVSVKADAVTGHTESDYSDSYNWNIVETQYYIISLHDFVSATNSIYFYYEITGTISKAYPSYYYLQITDGLDEPSTVYCRNIPNYSSYEFGIGDNVCLRGAKIDGDLKNTTVVSHNPNYVGRFEGMTTKINMSFSFTDSQSTTENGYALVTNLNNLSSGDIILFVNEANSKVAGELYQDDDKSYLESYDVIITNHTISALENGEEFVLGNDGGNYTFTSSEGVLGTTKAKYVTFDEGTTTWSISINDSGDASITSTVSSYGSLYYNSAYPRFLNYTTASQSAIQIYKKQSVTTHSYSVKNNSLKIQFAGLISSDMKTEIDKLGTVEYGVLYASDLGDNGIHEALDMVDSSHTYNEVFETFSIHKKGTVTGVDSTGLVPMAEDPTHYVFGVSFSGINMNKISNKINAAAYCCIDGVYHIMNERYMSVCDIADAYVKAKDTSSYTECLGFLSWLAGGAL